MFTYKLWEYYIKTYWLIDWNASYRPLNFSAITVNLFRGCIIVLCSFVTLCLDIIAMPIYIVAFIVWFIMECE